MVFEVVWTDNAKADFYSIIEYLKGEWSLKVAERFVEIFYNKIDLITTFPFVGMASVKDNSIRKILITKHNALYYQVNENTILLLDFFDTRQNPEKNLFD